MSSIPPESLVSAGVSRDDVRALLARYPSLSAHELEHIATFMKTAPLLDVGLLSSDPELGANYARFRTAEGRRLRPSALEIATFLALYLLPGALVTFAVVKVA